MRPLLTEILPATDSRGTQYPLGRVDPSYLRGIVDVYTVHSAGSLRAIDRRQHVYPTLPMFRGACRV